MTRFLQFRVVFLLAIGLSQAGAAGFGPLTTDVHVPEALRGRPIWHVSRLPGGELALGYDGGLALGFPGGPWRILASPGGQTVQAVAAGHGRMLVAGSGFCAFGDGLTMTSIAGPVGEYYAAEVVPEGWLVAGSDGIWLISREGVATSLLRPDAKFTGRESRLCRLGSALVVSVRGRAPLRWDQGKLAEDQTLSDLGDVQIGWADGDLLVTTKGITDRRGQVVLPESVNRSLYREGIVGVLQAGSELIVATFSGGVSAYDRKSGRLRWTWHAAGDVYGMLRDGTQILLGTAKGLVSIAAPGTTGYWGLDNVVVRDLGVDAAGGATVVTLAGSYALGAEEIERLPVTWPRRGEAWVDGLDFHFGPATTRLENPFVTGLAVLPEAAAVSLGHELILLSRAGKSTIVPIDGVVGAVAADGVRFLAATTMQGVFVVSPEGRVLDRIGTGRANVCELRPGKVALLFGDGVIRDSDAHVIGRVGNGTPRDAVLVQGHLAVLVTRPDRDPAVGRLEGDTWQPWEIPGLVEIGAEQIAADDTHFFVAGPRGVVRVRLPLVPSAPPHTKWRWSGTVVGGEVRLAEAAVEQVRVSAAPGDLPPAPATSFRVRAGDGDWNEVAPGDWVALTVAAGRTPVVAQAVRNGQVVESSFVVVRPLPWWQRAWAWPLHAVVLVGLVLGIARLRTRHLERRNRELETRVALRTEELRQANAVKEEFLASISHEIRNPLNGVVGICAMLADRNVGPRELLLVRTLGGCADQLRSMLDDILDFSQLARKAPTLANNDFELVALVEECARVMDPELSACSLLLPETPCWVHGDSGKLRQLACNLISNALKFGVPREAGIEVTILATDSGRARVRLAVRNTGPTIAASELPQLFESFRRGSHTGGIPGSGLGLAVCRRLSVALGGHLTAASADGITEFAFEAVLPSAQPPVRAEDAPAPVSRALAIEDEDYNRMVLGHVLRALGYAVDWAENGTAALRLAAANPYDLVLTDWRLPDMEGGVLCERLLAIMPAPKPPIIAVTAYASAEKMAEARAAGMAGFVTKPITREKLERIIRGLANNRQPRRSLDTGTRATHAAPALLASLGELAPSPLKLAGEIAEKWQTILALAELKDPRTASQAHSLRSLLLLAGEAAAAEQIGLLETAADEGDWATVRRLQPFAAEEVAGIEKSLRT